jgi:hypothetical protein
MSDFNVDMEQIDDFADVTLADAKDYQDQTGPAPIAPGAFRLRVEEGGLRKDSEGNLILDKGYPQVQLNKLTVVEPEEFAGKVIFPFQNYSLKPVTGGNRKGSIPVVDLLRGFDDTLTFASGKEAIQLLVEQIAQGNTFVGGTNWIAKDSEAIKTFIEENGGDLDDVDAEEKKKFFNAAIIRGQKRFPKVNGFYVPEIEGPSGDVLQARVSITRVYPSSKEVKKLGPYGKKGEKAAA